MNKFYEENKKAVIGAGLVTLAGLIVTAIWNLGGFAGASYIRNIADEQIKENGGVSQTELHDLSNVVTELKGAIDAQVLVNAQQDTRLNDSIDRLDGVIDAMIRANQNAQ